MFTSLFSIVQTNHHSLKMSNNAANTKVVGLALLSSSNLLDTQRVFLVSVRWYTVHETIDALISFLGFQLKINWQLVEWSKSFIYY